MPCYLKILFYNVVKLIAVRTQFFFFLKANQFKEMYDSIVTGEYENDCLIYTWLDILVILEAEGN